MAAVTPSVALLNRPSEAVMAVPAPSAPTLSMKYSAADTLLPPVEASLIDAVTVGAVFVGLGLTETEEVVGPVVSSSPIANSLKLVKPLPVVLWFTASAVDPPGGAVH